MKTALIGAVTAFGLFAATLAQAATTLTPANPQPTGLKSGLAVTYAFPPDVKTLDSAAQSLSQSGKRGQALTGLSYPDQGEGANVLTTSQPHFVAAQITGYIKFDAPGTYKLELYSNDGSRLSVGGATIATLDERSPCSSAGAKSVEVPEAGWYPIEVLYFQRWATACLEMDWQPPGGRFQAVPNAAFGH